MYELGFTFDAELVFPEKGFNYRAVKHDLTALGATLHAITPSVLTRKETGEFLENIVVVFIKGTPEVLADIYERYRCKSFPSNYADLVNSDAPALEAWWTGFLKEHIKKGVLHL